MVVCESISPKPQEKKHNKIVRYYCLLFCGNDIIPRYEVLKWLIPRRSALMFLGADLNADLSAEFSRKEIDMINTAVGNSESSNQFWATCHLCSELAGWGARISTFFHSCPLSDHFHNQKPCDCNWKGRMAVRLAQGTWIDSFSQELMNMSFGQATTYLARIRPETKNLLELDFNHCKVAMAQRFIQVYSFWRDLPWRICSVGICLFDESTDPESVQKFAHASKLFAQDVIDQWESVKDNVNGNHSFHMGRYFLDPTYPSNLRAYLVFWASSGEEIIEMPEPLSTALLQYCSSLTVMQQLEAQHHFLGQKIAFGRASLPASTCAFLRRRTNRDLYTQSFKEKLPRLIGDLSKLVAIKWERRSEPFLEHKQLFVFSGWWVLATAHFSMFNAISVWFFVCSYISRIVSKELIQHVYGFSLDAKDMNTKLQNAKAKFQALKGAEQREPLEDKEKTMRMDHIEGRLETGSTTVL